MIVIPANANNGHYFHGIMAIMPANEIMAIILAKEGITDYRESNATFVLLLR